MDQIKMKELEQIISSKYGNTTGIVIIKDGVVSCILRSAASTDAF